MTRLKVGARHKALTLHQGQGPMARVLRLAAETLLKLALRWCLITSSGQMARQRRVKMAATLFWACIGWTRRTSCLSCGRDSLPR